MLNMLLCKWDICDVRIVPFCVDRTFLVLLRDSTSSKRKRAFSLGSLTFGQRSPPAYCGINTPARLTALTDLPF